MLSLVSCVLIMYACLGLWCLVWCFICLFGLMVLGLVFCMLVWVYGWSILVIVGFNLVIWPSKRPWSPISVI